MTKVILPDHNLQSQLNFYQQAYYTTVMFMSIVPFIQL